MTELRLVIIEWDDAASQPSLTWEARDEERIGRCLVRTAGFVLFDDARGIEVCMSYHDEQLAGRWMVPRGCIVSVTELSAPSLPEIKPTDDQTATQLSA